MRHFLVSLFFYLCCNFMQAQNARTIIAELSAINQSVSGKSCDSGSVISHRGMNVFMADKTGYLSANTDLSYYTNYVTLNTAEGKFTVNHNFQQAASGKDAPLKKLLSIGFDMSLAGNYAKSFTDKRFENELGITINYKWLCKVKTRFAGCSDNNFNQQRAMNALRAALITSLEQEILKKEADFIQSLNGMDSVLPAGQDLAASKKLAAQNFYEELETATAEKFATTQAALLSKTGHFKTISTGWTSFQIYLPLFFPKYTVASSLVSDFDNRHPYPLMAMLGHTRLWESNKAGRLFVTLNAALLFNNSKLSYGLNKMNYGEYKSLGGTAAQMQEDHGSSNLYIGSYKTFMTASVSARFVYYPINSHVGISFLAEKDFGNYDPLQLKVGIPVVLINSKKTPAVTVECYALFLDIGRTIPGISKSRLGLSVGIPFSRLMY